MADWDRNEQDRREREARERRDWRGDRGPERRFDSAERNEGRSFEHDRDYGRNSSRGERQERPAPYEAEPGPFEPGGAAARGYGEGGDTSFGQQTRGSSGSGLGGYSGANVGGWGQPTLNSQWGQGGYGPLNQGIDYGQDGRTFGPMGYDSGSFGASDAGRGRPADEHHHHYRRWRDTQLSSHDRDYNRWRSEQARRYDEDYNNWRDERHSTFSREFEGWRAGRGGQAVEPGVPSSAAYAPNAGQPQAHGANPTLARIADGDEGRHHHKEEAKAEPANKDAQHH